MEYCIKINEFEGPLDLLLHLVKEKKKDIIKLGAICMEIDLTKLLDTDYTKENIREALFNDVENKVWINYPQLFRKNEKSKKIQRYFIAIGGFVAFSDRMRLA